MSVVDDIVNLYLRQGEIAAQQARDKVAQDEMERQNKHKIARFTLKALATFGPMFIPGVGPWGSLLTGGDVARRTLYGGPSSWGGQMGE